MEMSQKNYKQCDICQDFEATCLCPQCFCYFCDDCYKTVHKREKNKDHIKEKIDYNVPIDTRCPNHSGNNINLFCINEKGNIYYYIIIYRTLLCLLLLFKSSQWS